MSFLNTNHEKSIEQLKSGNFEKALEYIQDALFEDKSHPVLLAERATIFMYLKRRDEAFEDLDLAIYLQPENPYRYSSRAYVKDFFGDIEGAIADYEKCIKLDPEDIIAHNNLGLLIEKQGNLNRAKKHYKAADNFLEKNPNLQSRIKTEQSTSDQTSKADPLLNFKEKNSSSMSVAKDVLTKKSVFKEFIQFIFNGFKIKS